MNRDENKRLEMQKKAQQLNKLKIEKLCSLIIASKNILEIREAIKVIIETNSKGEVLLPELLKSAFSKYIAVLTTKISVITMGDFNNIDSLLQISNNVTSRNEIKDLLKLCEISPSTIQNKKINKAIEKLYQIIIAHDSSAFDLKSLETWWEPLRGALMQKTFILAKVEYNKLSLIESKDKLGFTVLDGCIKAMFNADEFARVIKLLDINLQTLKTTTLLVSGEEVTATAVTPVLRYISKVWQTDVNNAKSLLKYFKDQKLPFQADQAYNNALILSVSDQVIIYNLEFIEFLLELNVVDINTVITHETDKTCMIVKTPFSVAIKKMDFKLIELLLIQGADPYLANNIARPLMEKLHGTVKDYRMTSGLSIKLPEKEDQQRYIVKLDEFIENFFLNKLNNQLDSQIQQVVSIHIEANDTKFTLPSLEVKEEKSYEKKDSSPNEQTLSAVEKYINYKKGARENKDLPAQKILEHNFDYLLLNWIQTSDVQYFEALNSFVQSNPELNGYFATCLLNNNVSGDLVVNTFSDKHQLVNKFFTLKKALSHKDKTGAEVLKLQKNVVEVKGDFVNKIFVKISEDILNTLEKGYKIKLLEQLKDIHFIKTDSKGLSGLKKYTGAIKLKISGFDDNLYTTARYLDEKGNILFDLNRYDDHVTTPYQGRLSTIYQNFDNFIYSMCTEMLAEKNIEPPMSDLPISIVGENQDEHSDLE